MKTNRISKIFILCLFAIFNANAYSAITVTLTKYNSDVPDNVCNSSTYKYIATVSGVTGSYTLTFNPTNGTVESTSVSGSSTTATIKWTASTGADGNKGLVKADLLVGTTHYYSDQITVTIKSIKHLTATIAVGLPPSPWNLSPCESGSVNLEAGNMFVPGTGDVFPEKVNSFAWQVPSGWTVNGQASTGSNWIITSQNVTVTYPKSNISGSIKVKASYLTICGDYQESKESTAVTVNRNVSFAITADKSTVLCGDTEPVTFSVSPALPCALYYWNNSQTPTTSNSYQVTPDGHSNITATVNIVYGTSSTTLTKTLQYQLFPNGVTPKITGSTSLCYGTYSYSVSDLRPGYSVTWTLSPKLQQVNIIGNTITVSFVSSGSASIKANISTACGNYPVTIQQDVWIGKPTINPQTPLAYYDGSTYNNLCNLTSTSININASGTSNVEWSWVTGSPININWYQSGNNLNFYFYGVGQTAVYRVSGSNGCGTTSYDFGFKSIDCGGGGGCGAAYTVSPNPASAKVIIVPNIPAPCVVENSLAKAQSGSVTIYDQQGTMKKKKSYAYNTESEIDVSDLKNGTYVMQIYDGNETVKKTIIVKH